MLLVSVPYAFKAHEADTLGGLPSSAFVKVPAADEVSGSTANPSSPSGIASAGAQGKTSVLPPATVPVVAGSPCPSNALNPAVAVLPIFTTLGTSDLLCDSVISQVALGSNSLVNINGSVSMNGGVTANGANVSGPVFATGVVSASQYQINRQTAFSVLNPTSVSVGFSTGNAGSNADTFVGFYAGNKNTGQFNTYVGHIAGEVNSSGWYNTFIGSASGYSSTTGMTNAFLGERAGVNNTSGNQNVFLGQNAGVYSIIGSNNVYLASPGAAGNESNTTRIGFPYSTGGCYGFGPPPCGQKNTYIAGIYNVPLSPGYQQVIIDSTGHLGSTTSTPGGVTGMCGAPGSFLLTKWLTSTSVQCTNITELPGTFNVGINGVPNATAQLDVVGGLVNVNTTDTPSSYMIAYNPVLNVNPFGSRNLFVGVFTGGGGSDNTFVGTNAGEVNNGGTHDTFVGSAAGQVNTTGTNNTAMGWEAGMALAGGSGNTFLGATAGEANTADLNTFIGDGAGIANVTGYAQHFRRGVRGIQQHRPDSATPALAAVHATDLHRGTTILTSVILRAASRPAPATSTLVVKDSPPTLSPSVSVTSMASSLTKPLPTSRVSTIPARPRPLLSRRFASIPMGRCLEQRLEPIV